MILKDIKIFSQNVHKNNFIINIILKTQSSFNIIFIQKPSWFFIHAIPSLKNKKGKELIEVPNYPNWMIFSRNSSQINSSPRVITYINIRLSSLYFSLLKNIFNHRDISCVSFFNCSLVYFLINVYSDSSQSALKYLKNTEVNIGNTLIMTGDFNIRDNIWNLNFPHHSIHSNILFEVTDSLHLELSRPTKQVLTRYSDNQYDSNSVINLMFLRPESLEHNNYTIYPDWRLTSDHTPLTINISIFEKHIRTRK